MNRVPSIADEQPLPRGLAALVDEMEAAPVDFQRLSVALVRAASSDFGELFVPFLDRLCKEPDRVCPTWVHGDQTILWSGEGKLLSIKRSYGSKPPQTLSTLHGNAFLTPLPGSSVVVSKFKADGNRISDESLRTLLPGEIEILEVAKNAFGLYCPSASLGPQLTLCVFMFDPLVKTYAAYSRTTKLLEQEFSSNLDESRIDWALKVLGETGHSDLHSRALQVMLNNDAHFIRWTALQSLFLVDYDKAEAELNRFLQDSDPRIREAARRACMDLQQTTEIAND